jgi:hypothetical protein
MRGLGRWLVFGALVSAFGCGGEDRRPDTGAGSGQVVPATFDCAAFCQRLGDCVVILCNEDTNSTNYNGLGSLLSSQCEATCTEAILMSGLTTQNWQCLFQSSCRQVFDYDNCSAGANYHCN